MPVDVHGNFVEGSITEITRQCCKNVKAVLDEAGSGIEKVVRAGVFLADMQDLNEMNVEYEKWFSHKPARTCVAVRELPKGVKVSERVFDLYSSEGGLADYGVGRD